MKELTLVSWLLIIQFDVIRNLSMIEVEERSPVYWKTTTLRIIVGVLFNISFVFLGVEWWKVAVMQAGVYSFAFSIPLNIARRKKSPLLYMGTKSLPERIFAGKHLPYLWVKIWLFTFGIAVLYYNEIMSTVN